jgi:hypothetical protein
MPVIVSPVPRSYGEGTRASANAVARSSSARVRQAVRDCYLGVHALCEPVGDRGGGRRQRGGIP